MPNCFQTSSRALCLAAFAAAAVSSVGGCMPGYRPGGGQSSMDAFAYESTVDYPQTVKVVDLGTNAVLWTMEVPVGKQLIIRFYEDHDLKNERCPSLLRWELRDTGDQYGELHNSMPVPSAHRRRVDVAFRANPSATPQPEAAGGL